MLPQGAGARFQSLNRNPDDTDADIARSSGRVVDFAAAIVPHCFRALIEEGAMIEPYTAVGLIPTFWGIRRREDMEKNLEHLESLTKAAFWLSNLDIPVRLIAIPEGALQGFNDEVLDVDHAEFARTCAIDIPGQETDRLGRLARQWGCFIIAQAKARHEDWADRFFNVGFIIDPDGAVILKHYKISALLPCERSVSPHDVFDWWIAKYGRTLQAFWPVADTAIGRLGIMMAMEGSYPENGRGLALKSSIAPRCRHRSPKTIFSRSPTGHGRWRTTCMSWRRISAATTCIRTAKHQSTPAAGSR
jgi:predicted amidohydrolase